LNWPFVADLHRRNNGHSTRRLVLSRP